MKQRKIYVASSWRNPYQPQVVIDLRIAGHEVYDFRNPPNGSGGFSWSDIDPNWGNWNTKQYKEALNHQIAIDGFHSDFDGMKWADTCVMVLPCGRSANTEAGWMKGTGREVFVFSPVRQEPELMYKIYDEVIDDIHLLVDALSKPIIDTPNYVEEILKGKFPGHGPTKSYQDVLHGLNQAMISAQLMPGGAALTGQLTDIACLLWEYENNRLKSLDKLL
jgi:hypothetical protein